MLGSVRVRLMKAWVVALLRESTLSAMLAVGRSSSADDEEEEEARGDSA